jgi:hypothetical protein
MTGSIAASSFKTLESYITRVAPLLGTALGGPVGGVIGTLISSVFGVDSNNPDDLLNKVSSDPDAKTKLIALQNQHQEFLQNQVLEQYKVQASDLADARSRQVQLAQMGIHEWIMPTLSLMSMIQFWAYIVFCKYYNSAIDVTILTDLFAMAFMAFTFYFGSSHGERKSWINSASRAH